MKRRSPTVQAPRSKKKPKDGIRRPLSAYNIYFKVTRPVLIEAHERGQEQKDFDEHLENAFKLGKSSTQGALFQAASRTLAERWKTMSATDRDPFEQQAQEETRKYRIQVEELEMKKAEEEKAAAAGKSNAAGIKAKELPKQAPAPVVTGASTASFAGTTSVKGVRQQQSNMSDSEATTISSKSGPSNQQPSVVFNISNGCNSSSSSRGGTSQYPAFGSSAPNVICISDVDSVAKDNNKSSDQQQAPSDLAAKVFSSILANQLAEGSNGSSNNNNVAEEVVRKLATAAVLENILSDPTALLLVLVLLLQANGNQSSPPPPPPPPPPANPTAALLASLLQNNAQPQQAPPPQAPSIPAHWLNGLNMFQQQHQPPSVPPAIPQENNNNHPDDNQAALIENLSRLSEQERELLVKLIQQQNNAREA